MTQHRAHLPTGFERWGQLGVSVVLVMAFVTGGSSLNPGIDDVITQLLALPLALWAVFSLSRANGSGLRRAAIAVALLVAGTVATQQLPLPEGLWRSIAVRDALGNDMQSAGVANARHVWSLTPMASERGLWALMPALAVFLGALALPVQQHRRMLMLVVGLATASLILGFLQLGAPQDSVLNPFPEWAPSLNGFFANPNFQSTVLAVAVVILAALLASGRATDSSVEAPNWVRFALIVLAVLLFSALPLTGSRAVMMLAVLALVAVPLMLWRGLGWAAKSSEVPTVFTMARSRGSQIILGLLALGALAAALGWVRHDISEESRWVVAKVTAAMGWAQAPLGAGVGSFVPWFEQAAPAALVRGEYYNHAHNEYAQWWLESGVLGVASIVAVVVLLLFSYPRRHGSRAGDGSGVAVAAWLGCLLLLLHSAVDYPLRTPALMTVAGLLAGIVVSQRVAYESRRVHRKQSLTHRSPSLA